MGCLGQIKFASRLSFWYLCTLIFLSAWSKQVMPAKKKTKKVAKKKVTAKKKVAKKVAKKPVTSRKKAAKKSPARKKVAKKKASKKKVARKKIIAKKKVSKKKIAKKSRAKKKVTKKAAKKTISNKKATGNKNKKAMGKITNIKKTPTKKSQKSKKAAKKEITPYKQKRKNEDYMGPEQTEHFRYILLAWKSELMQEVDRTVHHMQDDATNFPDPNDRASQEEEFALELRTRDRERKLISKIDESIAMLDYADYGYCEICGIEIGIHRLEARPTATQCIDCKTLDEIKERHLG
jgi:DnaK suppressor protein